MKKVKYFVVFILIFLSAGFVWARSGGGGGMLIGYQTSTYPFLDKYPVANNSMELIYYGGFGGFVTGYRFLDAPVNLSIVSWTGLGGISTGILPAYGYKGFFTVLQEVTIEFGLPIIRWFMPTVFSGYQIAGNMIPGVPFKAFFSYTPVVGFRLQWGSFY